MCHLHHEVGEVGLHSSKSEAGREGVHCSRDTQCALTRA